MKTILVLLFHLWTALLSPAATEFGRKGVLTPPFGKPGESPDSTGMSEIGVQTTIFKVKGPEFPMSLLEHQASGDEALFLRLAAMTADGRAELVADQHFSVPQGRELRIEAMREFPYPTEYGRRGTEILPNACEFKGIGTRLEAELYAGALSGAPGASMGTAGMLTIENIRADQGRRVPVSLPDSPVDGVLLCPRFFVEKTTAAWRSADSAHHLVSMFRAAGTLQTTEEAHCLVFAKTFSPAPASGFVLPGDWRLHALSFRLNAEGGRALLDRGETLTDAGLLASLLESTAAGAARLRNHAILRMDAGQRLIKHEPARSPGPVRAIRRSRQSGGKVRHSGQRLRIH